MIFKIKKTFYINNKKQGLWYERKSYNNFYANYNAKWLCGGSTKH